MQANELVCRQALRGCSLPEKGCILIWVQKWFKASADAGLRRFAHLHSIYIYFYVIPAARELVYKNSYYIGGIR